MPIIQKSALRDIDAICALVEAHRFREDGSGALLPIRPDQVRAIIEDDRRGAFFSAVNVKGEVVGCVSVVIYGLPDNYAQLVGRLQQRLAHGHTKGTFHLQAIPEGKDLAGGDVGELRSLAVREGQRGGGLGIDLIRAAKEDAKARGLTELYSLVNAQVVRLFERGGFRTAQRTPQKLIVDCAVCPILERCNEIAVVADLR